jgi:cytochrome P450
MTLLTGGISTSAVGIAKVLDNYFAWPGRSPQDVDDPELMRAVVNETLRVDPIVEFLPRRAVADMTLRSGREIKAGTEIVVNLWQANRDASVFGPDADEFRPDRFRELPSKQPHYGMAFGAGAHLCIGKPLVTLGGADAPDYDVPRILPKVLTALLRAGVEPADDEEPAQAETYRRMLRTYPIVFRDLARRTS